MPEYVIMSQRLCLNTETRYKMIFLIRESFLLCSSNHVSLSRRLSESECISKSLIIIKSITFFFDTPEIVSLRCVLSPCFRFILDASFNRVRLMRVFLIRLSFVVMFAQIPECCPLGTSKHVYSDTISRTALWGEIRAVKNIVPFFPSQPEILANYTLSSAITCLIK